MRKLQSILLPTDFRAASREAARVAVRFAGALNTSVSLLHVIDSSEDVPMLAPEIREAAQRQITELSRMLASHKVTVREAVVKDGHPVDTIDRMADEMDADLVLIGAGEQSRFDRFSLGPVAAAVLEHAKPPVLAVRPGEPSLQFRQILCPVDASADAARGLENAVRLAKAFGGQLTVLTVVPSVRVAKLTIEPDKEKAALQALERGYRDELDKLLANQDFGSVTWNREVRTGPAAGVIVSAAHECNADLIVIGASGRTGVARFLIGSTTRRLIQQLPCSLLTVKRSDRAAE